MFPGGGPHDLSESWRRFSGSDLYCKDPAQHITTADKDQ